MRFDRGTILSVAGHGVFLVWALVTFARPFESTPMEAISADVISADDFSKMMAGSSEPPKKEPPKQLVEKIAEQPKPAENVTAKVAEKEVKAATDETQPEPAPKKADQKQAAAPPEPQKETKAVDKKEPEQKIDPIAEALKKEETKKPEKKAENKPQPVKKPEPQQRKWDPRQAQALIDKREPTRTAAMGSSMNSIASPGSTRGNEASISANEINALAARLQLNWTTPPGVKSNMKLRIILKMKRDGTLAAPAEVMMADGSSISQQLRESALRSIQLSQPFNMLRAETYDADPGWRELDLRFNPGDT